MITIQFFIIYVASQQLQGQLQSQHSVGIRIITVTQKYDDNNNNNNNNNNNSIQFNSLLLMCRVNSKTPITETAQCKY
jgi:hypothetical protein